MVSVSAESKPNVVLINADDLGYSNLGCCGTAILQTPNIERLAQEIRRFLDTHSASTVCFPFRYGSLRGSYSLRKIFWGRTSLQQELAIDTDMLTLPGLLKAVGYSCNYR